MAQRKHIKNTLALWTEDWKPTTDAASAFFMSCEKKLSDTCYQLDMYRFNGPRVASLQFKDSLLSTLHGRQYYYGVSGFVDSTGTCIEGIHSGVWEYPSSRLHSKQYENGQVSEQHESLINQQADVTHQNHTYPYYKGNRSTWDGRIDRRLEYPWNTLNLHLKGTVLINIFVTAEGKVGQPSGIWKSCNYLMDETGLNLISDSNRWEPATENGNPIASTVIQPIIFEAPLTIPLYHHRPTHSYNFR